MFNDKHVISLMDKFHVYCDNIIIRDRYIHIIIQRNTMHTLSIKWHDLTSINPSAIPDEFKGEKIIWSLSCDSVKERRRYYKDFEWLEFRVAELLYKKFNICCVDDTGEGLFRNPPPGFELPKSYSDENDFVRNPKVIEQVVIKQKEKRLNTVRAMREAKRAEHQATIQKFLDDKLKQRLALEKLEQIVTTQMPHLLD